MNELWMNIEETMKKISETDEKIRVLKAEGYARPGRINNLLIAYADYRQCLYADLLALSTNAGDKHPLVEYKS